MEDMPNGWREITLGEVCAFQGGYAFKSSQFKITGEYQVIKIKELKDGRVVFFRDSSWVTINITEYDKYIIKKGDILFALTGDPISKLNPLSWVGRVSKYGYDYHAILNQRVCKAIPNNKLDKYFLYFYFRQFYNFFNLAQKATGSASQANISIKTLEQPLLLLPPLAEQKAIAKILSSLDDKIELNNKINKNLEEQAQVIFKSWFVDFEPFGGVMPSDWKAGLVSDYFNLSIGKTPPRNESCWFTKNMNDIKWVSISDMGKSGTFIINTSEYLTSQAVTKFNILLVPKQSVLLSFKLTIGRVVITSEDMVTNEAIAHFTFKNNFIREYIYFYLKLFNFQSLGSTSSIATAINSKIIKNMPFIMPNENVLINFHKAVKPIFEKIYLYTLENQNLATIRDTLLPKLMSGEMRVVIEEEM